MDYYFHASKIQGSDFPSSGDEVEFTPETGSKGKTADNIGILKKKGTAEGRAFYGKEVTRTEIVTPGNSKFGSAVVIGLIGAALGGWLGGHVILGLVAGAILGWMTGENKEAVTRQVLITRPCIRCGGNAQVTSRVNNSTGFQCSTCGNFWKVSDDKLNHEELVAILTSDKINQPNS